jgi:hypothetical protein
LSFHKVNNINTEGGGIMALIAWYRLDDSLIDSSGNNRNLTITGTTSYTSTGKIGSALDLNGSSHASATYSLPNSNPFTMACWVRTTSTPATEVGIIAFGFYPVTVLRTNGGVRTWWYNNVSYPQVSTNTPINDGKWHHIATTYDGINVRLYLDGALQATTASSIIVTHSGLMLGREYNNGEKRLAGQIDDARFYNHSLTDMEVQELARAKILHYSFDDFQEPTTNLYRKTDLLAGGTAPQSIGYFTGTTSVANISDPFGTTRAIRLTGGSNPVLRYGSSSGGNPEITTGKTYTFSIYARLVPGQTAPIQLVLDIGDTGTTNFISQLDFTWKRVQATITPNINAGYGFADISISNGGVIELAFPQIEEKLHSTEFVAGTRSSTIRDNSGFFNDSEIVNLNGYGYKVDHTDQYGTWVKIFNHNSQNNANLFASDAEAAYNDPGNQNSNKFSILSQIPNFIRSDNKYKFKLQYPDVGLGIRNIWFQTSNPNTSLVSGYQPISIENSTNFWGGLERTNLSGGTTSTYIDGSVNSGNWWFSIGQKVSFTGGNPGPGVTVNNTSLYICIEDTKFIKNYPKWIFNSKIGNGAYSFGTLKVIDTNIKSISPDSFSVSVWFKSSSTSLVSQFLLSNNRYGDTTIGNRGIELGPYSTGNTFRYAVRLNNAWIDADIPGRFNDGNWHMATMVFTSGQNLKAYMDGQLIKTTNTTALTLPPTFESLTIGGNSFTNDSYFQGDIDNVHIYATALSDKDILDLYNTKAEIEQSGVLYARDFLSNAEETVNLLGIHSEFPTLTGWDSYGFGSRGTREIVSVNPALSGNTIKVTNNSATNGLTEVTRIISITPLINGNKLTVTGYVKGEGSSIGKSVFTHIYANSSEGALSTGGSPIVLTNNWQRITHTFTWTRTANSFSSCNIYFVANINIGEYFYVSNPQLEFKPYATPFISTFRPAIELPTGVQFGADEIHETGIANFEDFSTVGITDGLVAYYPLDKNAYDYAGLNGEGTINGATNVGGIINGAYNFNGTSNFISLNSEGLPYGSSPGTISAWGKTNTISAGFQWLISYGSPTLSQARFVGLSNSTFYFGGYGNDVTFPGAQVNEWFHICGVYDGTTAYLYINGNLVSSAAKSWNTVQSVARIGRQVNTASEYFNGVIDDVKIFNRALTAEEIKIEYNYGKNEVQIHESGVVYAKDLEQY